jgi:hypothetical protein
MLIGRALANGFYMFLEKMYASAVAEKLEEDSVVPICRLWMTLILLVVFIHI